MLEEKGRRKPHHLSGLNLVTYDRKGYPVETDLGRICGVLLVASSDLWSFISSIDNINA